MRCGTDFSYQPTDNFLCDIVSIYPLAGTEIWIFPNAVFRDRGIGYWLLGMDEASGHPFCEVMHDDLKRRHGDGNLCDAIVDSANNYLIPGSGLAKFLDEQVGTPYREAKERLLQENSGELTHGLSYFIQLPSPHGRILKGIIEAVSIRYHREPGGGLARLPTRDSHINTCVYQALWQAHDHGCRSIAIPQLASRPGYSIYEGNLAPAVMTGATLNAIVTFLAEVRQTPLKRICLHPGDYSTEEHMVLFLSRLK